MKIEPYWVLQSGKTFHKLPVNERNYNDNYIAIVNK